MGHQRRPDDVSTLRIMGVLQRISLAYLLAAIPFTLARYRETAARDRGAFHRRLIRRVAVLFALGLVLNASTMLLEWAINGAPMDVSTLRIMGVLQRISLAYLLAVLLVSAAEQN